MKGISKLKQLFSRNSAANNERAVPPSPSSSLTTPKLPVDYSDNPYLGSVHGRTMSSQPVQQVEPID